MSTLGMAAMLHELSGGSEESPSKYYGKKIIKAEISTERLLLAFEDGAKIKIWDDGQSCCEERHMSCEDDVSDLEGHFLRNIEVKSSGEEDAGWDGVYEWCFIEIATDQNFITLQTHNEHSGYYGGFGLSIKEIK